MIKNNPLIFAVVLNYNGWQDATECVESLKKVTYSRLKILIVDNGSTDASGLELEKLVGENIELLTTNKNLGIAGGNNIGIKYALKHDADFVLILSNDTTATPDLIEPLLEVIINDQKIAAVGPKILYYDDPSLIWFAGAKINPFLARAPIIGANQPDASLTGVLDVDLLMGCCMMVRREAFEQVGFFDERFFFQNEDLEFSYRLKKADWTIKVSSDSRLYHKISRTITPESYDRWYYSTRNRLLFIQYNLNFLEQITATLFFVGTRPFKFFEWLLAGRVDLIQASLHGFKDFRNKRWGSLASAEEGGYEL